jgi:hypothetical protein
VADATAAWKALDGLGPAHPLFLFKSGLEDLARDDFEGCRSRLREGIAQNKFSEVLNTDMQRLLGRIGADGSPPQPGARDAALSSGAQHIFLSAYTGKTN